MKYLKLFEDWNSDGDNLHKVSEDPIVDLVLTDLEYEVMNELIDDFNICEGIACYTYDYNANDPYINYLKNLLEEHKFRPSPLFKYNADELEEDTSKKVYDEFVNVDIYKKVLESSNRLNILKYLKDTSEYFYREFAKYIPGGMTELNKASTLGEMGYND